MSYHPEKYYSGLSAAERRKRKRKREIESRSQMDWDDPRAYLPWETGTTAKTRPSGYNAKFAERYENPAWETSLRKKARQSKIPLDILRRVMLRGMAAWRTGHRPGASQVAWGLARVNSFAVGGKTYFTADQDIARDWKRRTGEYFDSAGRRRRQNPCDSSMRALDKMLSSLPQSTILSSHDVESILEALEPKQPQKRKNKP